MSTKTIDATDIEVPKTSVVVVYPTRGTVALGFHHAMMEVERFDRAQGWGNYRGELVQQSGPNIAKTRNELVTRFLEEDDFEWAWFLDDDMVPKPDTLPRLLCSAVASGAKVIGGLCVMVGPDGPIPTIYQLGNVGAGEITRVSLDYVDNAVMQVAATGTGCLLVHRSVFEAIRDANPGNPYPWFAELVVNGNWVSEDLVFCLKAGELGFPVYVDTGAPVGHVKGGEAWWPEDIRNEKGFPAQRTAIVIPVKDKLDLTSDIVHQLRQVGGYDDLIVIDNGSGKATRNWLDSQDDLIVERMPDAGIHEMWNRGVDVAMKRANRQKRNLNIAFLNNDLVIGRDFVRRMVTTLRSNGRLAAISANYDGREVAGNFEPVTDICAGRYDGTGGLAGFAFIVKGEWFHSGYKFPEECRWYYGDNDLMMAIAAAGWTAGIAADATCVHIDGGSQTGGDWSDKADEIANDRKAFEARWARFAAGDMHGLDVEATYPKLVEAETDIKDHLPRLVDLVVKDKALKVIELGVRSAVSTVAWLYGLNRTGGHLYSVDINPAPPFAHERWTFTQGDDLDPFVMAQLPDDADLVFIDTSHSYRHTYDELEAYSAKLKPGGRFVLHDVDVEKHDHLGDDEPPFPVRKAIHDWLADSGRGGSVEFFEGSYGLAVVTL